MHAVRKEARKKIREGRIENTPIRRVEEKEAGIYNFEIFINRIF
jgi:hypothetical protein